MFRCHPLWRKAAAFAIGLVLLIGQVTAAPPPPSNGETPQLGSESRTVGVLELSSGVYFSQGVQDWDTESEGSLTGDWDLDPTLSVAKPNSEAFGAVQKINRPCCLSLGPRRHDCFFRIRASTLTHLTQYKGFDPQFENLGGMSDSDIGCASWSFSHLFVYQLDAQSKLIARSYQDGAWSNWVTLPMGNLQEIPNCLAFEEGTIHCFGRSLRNKPVTIRFGHGVWRKRSVPSQMLRSPSSCVLSVSKKMHCFAVGYNRQMKHTILKRGSGWSSWQSLGGSSYGTPSAVLTGSEAMKVFANSSRGVLSYVSWDGSDWSGWQLFDLHDPGLYTDVECVHSIHQRVDCFAGLQPNGRMHRTAWNGRRWSRWMVYNYYLKDKPICRYYEDGLIWCLLLAKPPKWSLASFRLFRVPNKNQPFLEHTL